MTISSRILPSNALQFEQDWFRSSYRWMSSRQIMPMPSFVSILDVETLLSDSGTNGFVHTRIVIKWCAARLVRLRWVLLRSKLWPMLEWKRIVNWVVSRKLQNGWQWVAELRGSQSERFGGETCRSGHFVFMVCRCWWRMFLAGLFRVSSYYCT